MKAEIYKNGKLMATTEVHTLETDKVKTVRVEFPKSINFKNNDVMNIKYIFD
jgi:hypothetical protein